MQYSLPIVSTPEGAIPDIVEDGVSRFVPQKNVTALADKLSVLIKDPNLRQKMGSAGSAKYEAQFTLGRFEHSFFDILNKLILGSPDLIRPNLFFKLCPAILGAKTFTDRNIFSDFGNLITALFT